MEKLFLDKHVEFLVNLERSRGMSEAELTELALREGPEIIDASLGGEGLKMGGIYWFVSSLSVMGMLDRVVNGKFRAKIVQFIKECYIADEKSPEYGSFSFNVGHGGHITSTHYALLILKQLGELENVRLDKADAITEFVCRMQLPDGAFAGDRWGENDLRFSYNAHAILSLMGAVESRSDVVKESCRYIEDCFNPDGAFGVCRGMESHGAYTYCAVAALAATNSLSEFLQGGEIRSAPSSACGTTNAPASTSSRKRKLLKWLAFRQTVSGGFNGRPEKAPDVCYSFWVLASILILEPENPPANLDALKQFILACMDQERGGISDRPDNECDVFHTFFGLAALGMIGVQGVKKVDPVLAIAID